jgi:hypothetical protein
MSRVPRICAGLALLGALAPASAPGDTPGRTRVTIRGTGNHVAIERSEVAARRAPESIAEPSGPLEEAVALKAGGQSDASVIAYLRAHESELPPVINAEDVRRLKAAGAGRSVIGYLAAVAAVDIGETGEGHEASVSAPAPEPTDMETTPYSGAPYAYPIGGGYGGYGYGTLHSSRFARPVRHFRAFPRVSPMAFHFNRPVFRRFPFPTRHTFSRLPVAPRFPMAPRLRPTP